MKPSHCAHGVLLVGALYIGTHRPNEPYDNPDTHNPTPGQQAPRLGQFGVQASASSMSSLGVWR